MNVETKHKLSEKLLMLSLITFAAVLWMIFRPVNIFEVEQPYRVLNKDKQVRRGGLLFYEAAYKKHYPYSANIQRNIICADGNLVTMANNRSNVPLGENTVTIELKVPEKTSLGMCYVEVNLEYKVNPFREVNYFFKTESFEVIK